MATLQVRFFGGLDVRCDGQPLPKPPTLKSQSLLAYLIHHRQQPQTRHRLAGLFWGDGPEVKARHSLATAVWHIRRCLPLAGYILSDSYTVQFDPGADLWLDVEEFEAGVAGHDLTGLESATSLYRGDFLDGFYDDWIMNERYRLQTMFCNALARLMRGLEVGGQIQEALTAALRLLHHDPVREDAHRLAMRAYCGLGQRSAALEQYRRCVKIVQDEFDTAPMAETTELYCAMLEGRFSIASRVGARPPAGAEGLLPRPVGRNPLDAVAAGRLVGRALELELLEGCWQRAGSGHGGLVLIHGEAGVGKTRLTKEFANRVRWQGAPVLWGQCYQFEHLLPYQPVSDALRAFLPTLGPAEVARLAPWIVGEVSRLVPEISERFASPEVHTPTDTTQEQARLFGGVAVFLSRSSAHVPLLMVIEDLHWASASTLQLLHYLARQFAGEKVMLLGTLRPEALERRHPLHSLERRLVRQGLAQSLPLPPLSPQAVEAMVVEMSGAGAAVTSLAERLYRETEGNPFYLMEIVKALFEAGILHLREGAWQGDFSQLSQGSLPLPTSLGEAIQARVDSLDDDVREALQLAAVLGGEFDFALLDALYDRGAEATLEALDDLLRHRLVDEGSGPTTRDYAFAHLKIQEVVYAGIPRRRRQHAHARAGAAMERLYDAATREGLSAELAHHFWRGRELDATLTEKATHYLLRAGDRARGLYAHREAIEYYQRALALLRGQADHERSARTLMNLGLTHHNAFDFRQARDAYEEGFVLWQRAGELRPATLPPAPGALRLCWPEPTTLDPAMMDNLFAVLVIEQLFSGLVERTPELEIAPGVARTWEVSDSGRTYVFHLRDDVHWSDGAPVKAGDFEYAWKRVLDPSTGSPNAASLYDIKGARAFHQGQAGDPDHVGVWAVDQVTLVVEVEEPTGDLPGGSLPVPRHIAERHGRAWTDVEHFVSNGPFRLKSRKPGESLVLARNPYYSGPFRGNVQQVELMALDWTAALERYEADGLDVWDLHGIPPHQVDQARQRHAADYVSAPWLATVFLGFDTGRSPFDDLRVRQAFVHAIDRERLADVDMGGYLFPAGGGFVPQGMPGHSAGIALPYAPDRARRLLAEAGYPGGRGLPAMDAVIFRAQAPEQLPTLWREILRADVRWQVVSDWASFRERLEEKRPHLFGLSWVAVHPDPDYLLRACPALHWTGWHNKTYDGLVEKARRVTDQGERIGLYAKADALLMQEAAIMPLGYSRIHLLVKPWVSRFPTSAIRRWFWKDIVIEPH
jgi:ABC-type oligopeptide transport system substrate-binding subunit/DNA-binding SARP family transcriptional activator